MMYDRYFEESGGDTSREVLDRAYALGVASVCGDPDEAAYDRLKRRSPDAYDETIIELAYDEGRANALDLEASETNVDGEGIWERLVEAEFGDEYGSDSADGVPEALRKPDRNAHLKGPPERLDLPSFLRR